MGTLCLKCQHKENCEIDCPAMTELFRFRREQHKKETRERLKELRELLNLYDCEPAEDLKEIAESVIDEHQEELGFIMDMEIEIGYVRSYQRKIKDGQIIYIQFI